MSGQPSHVRRQDGRSGAQRCPRAQPSSGRMRELHILPGYVWRREGSTSVVSTNTPGAVGRARLELGWGLR